jgi:site-specific DNA recombinase
MNTNTESGLRVAIYARVSTEEQREGQTIDSQILEVEKYASQNHWSVTDVYKDEGWSGSMLARPELDRLRDAASKGVFEAVLINDVDRLARDVAHLGIIKRDLERKGVRLIFRKLPGENSPTHDLMVNILGSFAQFERELIADRTRRGRRHKAEVRKQYVGCTPPYGYLYIPQSSSERQRGVLRVNVHEAAIVRRIFSWIANEGLSLNGVVRRLAENGIPTRSGKTHWGVGMVGRVVRNRTYIGTWAYGKAETVEPARRRNATYSRTTKTSRRPKPRSEWLIVELPEKLRIVDEVVWYQAQRQIDANPRFSPRNVQYPYLLQGLIRCGICSGAASGTHVRERAKDYFYYRCSRRSCGGSRWIPRDVVEGTAWESLKEVFSDPKRIEALVAKARERILNKEKESLVKNHKIVTAPLDEQENRLISEYRSRKVSASELGNRLRELERQRLRTIGGRENETPAAKSIGSLSDCCAMVAESVQKGTFETRQHVFRKLTTAVLLTPDKIVIRAAIPDSKHSDHDQASDRTSPFGASAFDSPLLREYRSNDGTISFDIEAPLPKIRTCERIGQSKYA